MLQGQVCSEGLGFPSLGGPRRLLRRGESCPDSQVDMGWHGAWGRQGT